MFRCWDLFVLSCSWWLRRSLVELTTFDLSINLPFTALKCVIVSERRYQSVRFSNLTESHTFAICVQVVCTCTYISCNKPWILDKYQRRLRKMQRQYYHGRKHRYVQYISAKWLLEVRKALNYNWRNREHFKRRKLKNILCFHALYDAAVWMKCSSYLMGSHWRFTSLAYNLPCNTNQFRLCWGGWLEYISG